MKKNLALLIPCYNSSTTIGETLDSIKNQKSGLDRVAYIVIADDVSPDNTAQVAKAYWGNSQPPLKLEQRKKNHGEYLNVNMAVQGMQDNIEWLVIMHGDNLATNNYLELLIKHIDKADTKTALISGSWQDFNDEQGILNEGDRRYDSIGSIMINGTNEAVKDTLFKGCWWHISCTAIRISSFKAVGGLPRGLRQKGDYDFLLRILANGYNVEYLPIPLMLYRSHVASMSSKNFKTHRDITETLWIVCKFIYVLSFTEITKWYIEHQSFLVRRFVSALLKFQMERMYKAIPLSFHLLHDYFFALKQHFTKNYFRPPLVDFMTAQPEGETPTHLTIL
jgi:rhamnosyltransferase